MSISPQEALTRTIEHREIFHDEMVDLMRRIMRGEISPVMVSALLTGLRVKKETIGEISAAAQVLREFSIPVQTPAYEHFIDIVGTGGDSAHTFNISTASTFVAAACGAHVAKHGNRAVSSSAGAADVLEAFGAAIDLEPAQVACCLENTRVGFLFAPHHHPLMKVVGPIRRELGIRTLFNILGPLTNPAGAPCILMGVFHPDLVGIQVRVLQRMGMKRAMVVWGTDGLDEITVGGPTLVGELRDNAIREYEIEPSTFGVACSARETLRVGSAAESKARVLEVLADRPGPARDVVCLNAGAAIYVAGLAESVGAGVSMARECLRSGAARERLDSFIAETRRLKGLPPGE